MEHGQNAGPLARTPLFDRHRAAGGRIVPFAGYEMPVQYNGIIEEHTAVRTAAGLFDVSHMGEFEVKGANAAAFLDHITPTRISTLADMKAAYTGLLTERGTFVDDILVYRLAAEHFLVVVNASNTAKDWDWFVGRAKPFGVQLANRTDDYALLALQGPLSIGIVAGLAEGFDATAIKYYHLAHGKVAGRTVIAARTGYTGELGYELFCSPADAPALWDALLEKGRGAGVIPAGLGARDTLRLEAAMPLYGNDIDDTTTVLEAGLEWVVDWDKPQFVGRAALAAEKEQGSSRVRGGFEVKDKGIARHGNGVVIGGRAAGEVTSGTWSPTLGKAIGMAYFPANGAAVGTPFEVDVRGRRLPAEIVPLPFYKRPKKKA